MTNWRNLLLTVEPRTINSEWSGLAPRNRTESGMLHDSMHGEDVVG
jgi:hypothetical protein